MIKVGITGGIGSGKSLICEIFRVLGVPVFHADSEAKKILNSSEEIKEALITKFGLDIYSQVGEIDRSKFGNIIFNDKDALEYTNKLIHPYVVSEFQKWSDCHSNYEYILHEAAILFESGVYKLMDKVIWVEAPEKVRISRVVKRDNILAGAVMERINNQWDFRKVKDKVDFIINNDGKSFVISQVLDIHNHLKFKS